MPRILIASDSDNTGSVANGLGWARRVSLGLPPGFVADILGVHIYASDTGASFVSGVCHNLRRGAGTGVLDVMNEPSSFALHSGREAANGRIDFSLRPVSVAGDQLFFGWNGSGNTQFMALRVLYVLRRVSLTEWTEIRRETSIETE